MRRIMGLLSADRLGGQTVIAFGLKGIGAAAAFAMSWLIARAFGAAGAGTWGLAITTVTILATVAVCGMDTQLMRVAAGDRKEGRPDLAAAAVRAIGWRLALAGLVGAALLWLAHAPVAARVLSAPAAGPVLALLAWTMPALVMVRVASVALRAGGRLFASQAIDGPLGTGLAAVLLAAAVFGGGAPDLQSAAMFQLIGTGAAAVVAWILYRWLVARGVPRTAAPRVGPLAAAGVPVLLSGLTSLFNDWFPAVIVAASWPIAEVGLLRVAMQFVALAALVQLAMEAVTGPRIAAAARIGDTAEIARVVRRSVQAVLLLASPLLLVLLVFPAQLMRLFGPEFVAGALTLQILAVGQAVRLAAGPLGTVLIMTGHQRWLLVYAFAGVLLTIGFAYWLIPLYGAPGAAAAGAVTLIFRNAAALWMVQNKAGVRLFGRARGSS